MSNTSGFNALAGVRGFGGKDGQWREVWLDDAVSMPWRAFGGSEATIQQINAVVRMVQFQCPGGRSGVRSEFESGDGETEIYSFNALAGVRGFGVNWLPGHATQSYSVSMPWRAFGGSEVSRLWSRMQEIKCFNALAGVRGFGATRSNLAIRLSHAFQCPGGRSGVRRSLTLNSICAARPSFNALAGVRGFGGKEVWTAGFWKREFQCPGGRSGVRRL